MIGIDAVKIERIAEALKSARFSERIFTEHEREYALSKKDFAQTFAGIYAAKEAVFKAVGRRFKNLIYPQIEILHEGGAPYALVRGERVEVSITHDGGFAVAIASCDKIDLPRNLFENISIITAETVALSPRLADTHKGDYASVKILAGSPEYVGAAMIAHEAALSVLQSGAGMVTLCVPRSLAPAYQYRVKDEMLRLMPDVDGRIVFDEEAYRKLLVKTDVVLMGCGLGRNAALRDIIRYICLNFEGVLVLDADALNEVSEDIGVLEGHKCRIIMTPHIGEFRRLINTMPDINRRNLANNDELCAAVREFALKTESVVVCKSDLTLISDGVKTMQNITGTPAMAKGGSGDVLAGIIAAECVFRSPIYAAAAGCYAAGKRGEAIAAEVGEDAVLPSMLASGKSTK